MKAVFWSSLVKLLLNLELLNGLNIKAIFQY